MPPRRDRCEGCPAEPPADYTDLRLRVAGWHIFEGALGSGKQVRQMLCPQCLKKTRAIRMNVMDDQEELF